MDYPIAFGIVMIYIIVTIVIAVIVSKKVRSSDSFLVATRSLPWFLVLAVVVGEWIGAGTVIGVAQRGYTDGITGSLYNVGMFIALVVFAVKLAARYRRAGVITVPEIVKGLFDKKTSYVSSVMLILAYFVIIVITIVGGSAVLSLLFGISHTWGLAISAGLFVAIAIVGGLVAVSITNIMHVVVLIIGLVMALIFGLVKVGGWTGLSEALPASYFDITGGAQPQMWTGEVLSVVIGFIAAQVLIMGILASKNPKAAVKGSLASAIIVLPIGVVSAMLGMLSRALYGDVLPHGLAAAPAAMLALNPWIAGFALCGLAAAIISSGPAVVLGLSQLVVRDVYVGIINPAASDKKVLFYSRAFTLVMGILAFILSLTLYEILTAVYWVFAIRAGIGALILMVTYLGMKRVNERGAFWGLLCGLGALVYWTLANHPFGIHEVYPMIAAVVVVSLIVSAVTKRKVQIPDDVRNSFKIAK